MSRRNRRIIQNIAIDLDQTLVDLHTPWITWGNDRFGTDLSIFTRWNQPTEMWGQEAYEFFATQPYARGEVCPFTAARTVLKRLRALGYFVEIVTSCIENEAEKKLFCFEHELITEEFEFCTMSDKSACYSDLLVDDRPSNLSAFMRGCEDREDHLYANGAPGVILIDDHHNYDRRFEFSHHIPGIELLPSLVLSYPYCDTFRYSGDEDEEVYAE